MSRTPFLKLSAYDGVDRIPDRALTPYEGSEVLNDLCRKRRCREVETEELLIGEHRLQDLIEGALAAELHILQHGLEGLSHRVGRESELIAVVIDCEQISHVECVHKGYDFEG